MKDKIFFTTYVGILVLLVASMFLPLVIVFFGVSMEITFAISLICTIVSAPLGVVVVWIGSVGPDLWNVWCDDVVGNEG